MRRLAVALLVLVAAAPAAAQSLTASAAISMKEAVEELGQRFARARPGAAVRFNFGASGELARQVEAGAPVDVFVSASTREMDALERQGLILADTRRSFAANALAVVRPADVVVPLDGSTDLVNPGVRRIAIGDPRIVPAGWYARAHLRTLELWERVEPKLVLAGNVRQVLDWVARGEVDAAFVYVTDLALRPREVREAYRPAPATYPAIVYPAAVVAASRHPALASAFVDFLAGPEGRAVLARHGFLPPPGRR